MAKRKGPGRSHRKGLSIIEAVRMFSDEAEVERMLVKMRWPDGVRCPDCGSDHVSGRPTRKPQPFRCNSCRKDFSVKTGTVMHASKIPLSKWATAAYLMTTGLKGVSSMKLHRDLGVSQKTAWHLAHRIRKAWESDGGLFSGPVEVDETYVGGKERNRRSGEKLREEPLGGKSIVAGAKDRATGKVSAAVVDAASSKELKGFIRGRVAPGAKVYTDGHSAYRGLPNHSAVMHSRGEYVRGKVHTNGIESHWAALKRGIVGTYHQVSMKHLNRYLAEFEGRHNVRPHDTIDQIAVLVRGMDGKRLGYEELVGPPGTRLNQKKG